MADRPIGLALGGGGALGFAHVPVLEGLDEMGIRPAIIAGSSMGAIIGAFYAAGHTGQDIAGFLRDVRRSPGELAARLWRSRPQAIRNLFTPMRSTAGQLSPEAVLEAFGDLLPASFAELEIPLKVVATDFYGWREVVLSSGALSPAVAASMALPFLFRPVVIGGRAMVDGGVVNPVPFEHATVDGGLIVAVDVLCGPVVRPGMPRPIEAMIGATQLTMRAVTAAKLLGPIRPDVLIEPPIMGFRPLEFGKIDEILEAAAPAKDDLKRRLEKALRGG